MAYKKIKIDNTTCSRRFHITFDDEGEKIPKTTVRCLYCNLEIYKASKHPKLKLARDEIIIKTSKLSPYRTKMCNYKDLTTPQKEYST